MKRLALVAIVLVVALVGANVVRASVSDNEEPLVIVQWSNSHPMRDGLLPSMAEQFNAASHETASGQPIEIVLVSCDSAVQADDLVARAVGAGGSDGGCVVDGEPAADPVIVTPQSRDWLVDVNHRVGTDVVDLAATDSIAETWLGIVTYREMAECLGWPDKQLGYRDILALRNDPAGWSRYPDCAKSEWGRKPLLAFTNPKTSTSGRNVLVSLYSIAANKPPGQLTVADIEHPEVVDYVKDFQQLVDHYLPGTIPLNRKISQGVRYGQFFLMPEDNLVSLYKGNELIIGDDGKKQPLPPVDDLVMIYPSEGAVLNSNPAGIVNTPWVSETQADAAREWIDYLRDDAQQRTFIDAGFRPAAGTSLSVDERQFAQWGLDAQQPQTKIEPGELDPLVLEKIMGSWGAVKNPAVVTFVVDVSASMAGDPLEHVQTGMTRLLDAMSGTDNQVGLVTFSEKVLTEIPPAPLRESRFAIGDAIGTMQASGGTALYDALQRAVQLTDAATGDRRATRAVVVLSDGVANKGSACLDDVVSMITSNEIPISEYCAQETKGSIPLDIRGKEVAPAEVRGDALRMAHEHPVQIFFVGFGEADINVGRILAEATGAEYQGSTEADLVSVIETLSAYF